MNIIKGHTIWWETSYVLEKTIIWTSSMHGCDSNDEINKTKL